MAKEIAKITNDMTSDLQPVTSHPKKVLVKVIHLHSGSELMGSKTTIHHREAEIELLTHAVIVTSKKTKRKMFIPLTNVKVGEFLPE